MIHLNTKYNTMVTNGFVINPYYELLPEFKISPFTTKDIKINRNLKNSELCDDYFKERFHGKEFYYTRNGRQAINIALEYYRLDPSDCVTILTTSGNFYISSCVTNEIEKYCQWSRKIEINTKVIFVNHEFGYPFPNLMKLKEYNIPIIEDCAHSFFSTDKDNTIGTVGDFIIYSFPKIFPIQIGGLLVTNKLTKPRCPFESELELLYYIKNVVSNYIPLKEKIIQKRLRNYSKLKTRFELLDFTDRFELTEGIIPGVFMFNNIKKTLNLSELKKYYYMHGVQCSVFYGEDAFFLPCHQNLNGNDIEYFYEILKSFIKINELC